MAGVEDGAAQIISIFKVADAPGASAIILCIAIPPHIFGRFTDNKVVGDAVVISFAVVTAILLFPLHVSCYVYFNSEEKYLALNVTAYRLVTLFRANSVKNAPDKIQVNGRESRVTDYLKRHAVKIFNNVSLTKITQLGDYGVKGVKGACAACVQNALTDAVYSVIADTGGRTRLKNYIVLNGEHENIVYYAKISGIINVLAVIKVTFVLITEKIYEHFKKAKTEYGSI